MQNGLSFQKKKMQKIIKNGQKVAKMVKKYIIGSYEPK